MVVSRARRTWVLAVLGAGVLFSAFAFGFVVAELEVGAYPRIRAAGAAIARLPVVRGLRARFIGEERAVDPGVPGRWAVLPEREGRIDDLDWLRSIGYLDGSRPAGNDVGITFHVPSLVSAGWNLWCSGHETSAFLMDMDGAVAHSWSLTYEQAFPGGGFPENGLPENELWSQFWRRVHLLPGGDLLAIYDGLGMIRIDRDSGLHWSVGYGIHHDIDVSEGRIYTLGREVKQLPRIHPDRPTLEDLILVLDLEGHLLDRISVLEALERSSFAPLLENRIDYGDILHTNSIEVLDGTMAAVAPFFAKGNVLISMRNLNTVAIVDPEAEEVVWAATGQWIEQHDPIALGNGRILLFDNKGHGGMSKVIEFDPLTQEILWSFEGTTDNGFQSATCGANQRLPNGNTLIVESDGGRAFEVTPDRHLVWEFHSPARAGTGGGLVATLFDLVRVSDEDVGWLHERQSGAVVPIR